MLVACWGRWVELHPPLAIGWKDCGLALIVLRLPGAVLVMPVMEKPFCGSLILRWLDRSDFTRLSPQAVSPQALLYCGIPFGLEHHPWLAGILAGLTCGWLYRPPANSGSRPLPAR